MKRNEQLFLKRVRAILIYCNFIGHKVVLHEPSWLSYYNDGYTPIQAVKEDMQGYAEIPFIQWSKVHEIFLSR